MLPEQPVVGLPVHPLGLLREGLRHVRAPAELLPYLLGPSQGADRRVLPLALVDKIVAVTAQEVASRPVQDRNPPAAPGPRTYEPRPLPAEVAGRPAEGDGLTHVYPLGCRISPVAVKEQHLLRPFGSLYRAPDRSRLPSGPRPAQGKPVPRLQQTFLVEVAHVHAVALARRGLFVEPVPVAASRAAQIFLPV